MKKIIGILCFTAIFATVVPARAQDEKLDERLNRAAVVIDEVMHTPDRGIPQSILAGAKCVVVIPGFKKGAFIGGVQYGQGVATCRTPRGWSAPVFVLKDKFKIGGDAAASAGPVGRNAQAGTDWKLSAEFLTYSRSKGLFAGIDLDGTVLSQNGDDTRTEYGSDIPFGRVLHGEVPAPADSVHFVHTVARYFNVARADRADR